MKTLLASKSPIANRTSQLDILDKPIASGEAGDNFNERVVLANGSLLTADHPTILQINLGYMCNQTCSHCHVDAGPDRKEVMTQETMEQCLEAIDNSSIQTVDLTGGAPEMNPKFRWFVEQLASRNIGIIVRSNLTILDANDKYRSLPTFFASNKVEVIASLPCYTEDNTDRQRGEGVFKKSVEAIRKLNAIGYGLKDSELKLNLVFNPGGTGLPGDQRKLESDYRTRLYEDHGLYFTQLYTITNMPISRFLDDLIKTGQYERYMQNLIEHFNVSTLDQLMCKNTVSVDWKGYLFDCDFNQMLGLNIGVDKTHIRSFNSSVLTHREIVTAKHCFGCTAGAGSSCQGALT